MWKKWPDLKMNTQVLYLKRNPRISLLRQIIRLFSNQMNVIWLKGSISSAWVLTLKSGKLRAEMFCSLQDCRWRNLKSAVPRVQSTRWARACRVWCEPAFLLGLLWFSIIFDILKSSKIRISACIGYLLTLLVRGPTLDVRIWRM